MNHKQENNIINALEFLTVTINGYYFDFLYEHNDLWEYINIFTYNYQLDTSHELINEQLIDYSMKIDSLLQIDSPFIHSFLYEIIFNKKLIQYDPSSVQKFVMSEKATPFMYLLIYIYKLYILFKILNYLDNSIHLTADGYIKLEEFKIGKFVIKTKETLLTEYEVDNLIDQIKTNPQRIKIINNFINYKLGEEGTDLSNDIIKNIHKFNQDISLFSKKELEKFCEYLVDKNTMDSFINKTKDVYSLYDQKSIEAKKLRAN